MSLANESREMLHCQSASHLGYYYDFLKKMLADGTISKNSCLIDAYNSAPNREKDALPAAEPDLSDEAVLKDTKTIINYLQNLNIFMRGPAVKGFKKTVEDLIKNGKVQPYSKIAALFEQETGQKICREVLKDITDCK